MQWKDNKKSGKGIFSSPDGKKYVGEVKDDKKHGKGTYTSPDGNEYVGEYKDDKYDGKGTFTAPDGSKYQGEWKEGKFHGKGTVTSSENVKEDLYFVEGAIVGQHIKCSDAPFDKLESLLVLHEEADSEICGMITSSKNKRYCQVLEKEIQICKSKMKE